MYYIMKNNELAIYEDDKAKLVTTLKFMPQLANEHILQTDIITAEELQQNPNKVIIGDVEIEVDVPDYETQTVEQETPVFDESGEITGYETKTVEIQVEIGSHKEIITVKGLVLNPNYEAEQIESRKQAFEKDFFKTSLGYVRRKVSMATGETKDFLSDLLPTISLGIQTGTPVTIIAYNEPDFTTDEVDWEALQTVQTVNAQFIQECFLQLSNDFLPNEV